MTVLRCLVLALIVAWPSSASAQLTFLQSAASTSDLTTYTFAAQNFGTADADRYIIVAIHGRDGGIEEDTIDSVTVGGVSASLVVQIDAPATTNTVTALFIAAVPTGTSGDVVVTFSEQMQQAAIGLYAAIGLESATASDTDSDDAGDSTVSLDVPEDGFAIGACSIGGGTTMTWTGLTQTYATTVDTNLQYTGASDSFEAAQTGLSLVCNSNAVTNQSGVFASWAFETAPSVFTQTFLQTATSLTDTTAYTFSAQNIGTAADDRCIIAAVHSRMLGATPPTLTVTIGGVSATLPVERTSSSTNTSYVGLAIAAVPTGTTADVVLTFSATQVRAAIALYSTTGLDCSDPPTETGSSTDTNPTASLNVRANGFAIGACAFAQSATTTWTGITERYDAVVEATFEYTGASADFADAQAGLELMCNSGSTTDPAGVFASWGPEGDPDPPTGNTIRQGIIGGGVF